VFKDSIRYELDSFFRSFLYPVLNSWSVECAVHWAEYSHLCRFTAHYTQFYTSFPTSITPIGHSYSWWLDSVWWLETCMLKYFYIHIQYNFGTFSTWNSHSTTHPIATVFKKPLAQGNKRKRIELDLHMHLNKCYRQVKKVIYCWLQCFLWLSYE